MKTMMLSSLGMITVDPETMTMDRLSSDGPYVNRIYLVEEDCHLKCCKDSGEYIEADVKAGDVVLYFWNDDLPHRICIVRSDELVENIKFDRKEKQREKEEWAAKKASRTKDEDDD